MSLTDPIAKLVSGDDLPRGKPDPLPYLETQRHLDLAPDAALAVEAAVPGAVLARSAGLCAVGMGAEGG